MADVAGGFAANEVGGEYKLDNSSLNYITHKLAHGIIGAGMGALSNGEALSGAIGGIIGEMTGEAFADGNPEAFDSKHPDYDPEKRADYVRNGTALAQISAATVAGLLGQDPNAASITAQNAVKNNCFLIRQAVNIERSRKIAYANLLLRQQLKEQEEQEKKSSKSSQHSGASSSGHTEGFDRHEGTQMTEEGFSIPDPSDREKLPPYVAHPDDFASTRGSGGYDAHPDADSPQILSTPTLDTDPNDSILMKEKVYIVYEKEPIDQSKGQYTGRTSGIGDIDNPEDLRQILRARDRNHHMNKEGYQRAEIQSTTTDPLVSRGQEQLGIEENGGAQSTGDTSGNRINGIAQKNPRIQTYLDAAKNALKDSL